MSQLITSFSSHVLYLTSTGRLARRLLDIYRCQCIEADIDGWFVPAIFSLNEWLHRQWTESWPESYPAPDILRFMLWKKAVAGDHPPGVIENDASLYRLLDETYGALIRHGQQPTGGFPSTPLVEWRRSVSRVFQSLMSEQGYFHPAELPLRVKNSMNDGSIPLPPNIILVAFESPPPCEDVFFSFLRKMTAVTEIQVPCRDAGMLSAIALPSQEQEVLYCAHRLVEDAQCHPLHRIGVVVPNLNLYGDMLRRHFTDIMGTATAETEQFVNISLGRPVSNYSLVSAALLPFRFLMDGQSRHVLLSLLLSPYYALWRESRSHLVRADHIWRRNGADRDLEHLCNTLRSRDPVLFSLLFKSLPDVFRALASHPAGHRKKAHEWIDTMRALWSALEFPVMSSEADELAWRHFSAILTSIARDIPGEFMTGTEYLALINDAVSHETTQPRSFENAGIQVMGMIESRGLDFDRLYFLDMNDRSLPQPVRPLPFLDPVERARIQGGTTESQYVFSERIVSNIVAMTPDITLLRAEEDEGKPLVPSPFWPDASSRTHVDIWKNPGPALMRAPWLASAFHGLSLQDHDAPSFLKRAKFLSRQLDITPPGPERFDSHPGIPPELSVADIRRAFACPYTFFIKHLCGIEPLDDVQTPLSPRDRGSRIHQICARFTALQRDRGIDLIADREEAMDLLAECIDDVLSDDSHDPFWYFERSRLLDRNGPLPTGLLVKWIDNETERYANGARCRAEEITFDGVCATGWPFSVRGRIDRVDIDAGTIVCWDYKTGTQPRKPDIVRHFIDPQLPLYSLAVAGGRIPLPPDAGKPAEQAAGYIQLKSEKEVKAVLIPELESSLGPWTEKIREMGRLLQDGSFVACPAPFSSDQNRKTVCRDCAFRPLCIKGLQSVLTHDEHGENNNDRS